MSKIRTGELGEITSRTKDSLRGDIARGAAPWDDGQFESGVQRRYDGMHILALTISEMLQGAGLKAGNAAEAVRYQSHYLEKFLELLEAGQDVSHINVMLTNEGRFDELSGYGYDQGYDGGDAETLGSIFSQSIRRFNTKPLSERAASIGEVSFGVLHCSVVSVLGAYLLAQKRARSKGYILQGREIFKAGPVDSQSS